MEKGIPLPEFPLEQARNPGVTDPTGVLPILGTVFFSLSVGTMIVLYRTLEAEAHSFWISPLPFAFLGVGLMDGAELQWLRQVKRRRALQGCNHAEG